MIGCGLLAWYLVLFIQFYRKTYKVDGEKKANGVNGTANGNEVR